MVGPSLFVLKFVLGDCFWCLFWGPFLDSVLVPVLGGPVLGLVNKKQQARPHCGPRFGSRFGPILGPILRTNLEFFVCLVVVLKLVVLGFAPPVLTVKHLVRAIFSCQRLFFHRLFEGSGGEFQSKFFIVMVASMLCLAKPCRYLGGTPMVVRGFLLFLGPNLGPRKRYAGEFAFLYTCDCLAAACWTRTCQPSWKAAKSAAAY